MQWTGREESTGSTSSSTSVGEEGHYRASVLGLEQLLPECGGKHSPSLELGGEGGDRRTATEEEKTEDA